MAENLLFRGGSTTDVNNAATTINDRELVIDTTTNQIVLGSAKDRTVMSDSGNNIDLHDSTVDLYSATTNPGSKTFQLFSDIGGARTERVYILASGSAKFEGSLNVGTVSVHADNSAAIAGGLSAGDIYRKSDGTLMITY